MRSKEKIKMFLVIMVFAFISITMPKMVFAQSDSDYVVMPSKSNVAIDRVFNIKFNYAVDQSTVTSDNISIKDASGKNVDISLKLQDTDKSMVEVKPLNSYNYSQNYTLVINTNIKSVDGKKMNKPVKLDFSTKANSGDINTPITTPTTPVTTPTGIGTSFTVCLDAGHGGNDAGIVSPGGVKEKDIDLQVVLKAGKLLEQNGINVIYTRKDDSTVDTQTRINAGSKANYFISVHGNQADNLSASGIETYYDQQNTKGQALATAVQGEVLKQVTANNRGIKVATNAMQEVFNSPVPSVKLYLGFLSNDNEANSLASDDYENKLAQGIANAVINMKNSDVTSSPSSGTGNTTPDPSNAKYTICLDAGHGGYDSGAVGTNGTKEKDVTLPITLKVGDLLKQKGINVVYTRTSDNVSWPSVEGEDLRARCDISNNAKVNYFVAIHANSVDNSPSTGGIETIYVDGSSDGKNLASNIQKELINAVGLKDRGAKIDTRGLYVLQHTNCPAVLTELGFLSNPTEEALLNSDDYQNKCADAIAKGIYDTLGI